MTRQLTALSVGNFKAFGDTQILPIKPLTLIYGPNSAGKSSLVQALALAHEAEFGQASATGPMLDIHQTRLGGSAIDLGGFRQYVHRGQARQRVEWGVELDLAARSGAEGDGPVRHLSGLSRVSISVFIGIELDDEERPRAGAEPRVDEVQILGDGTELLRMSRRPRDPGDEAVGDPFRVDRLAAEHPAFGPVLLDAMSITQDETLTAAKRAAELDGAFRSVVPALLVRSNRFLPADAQVILDQPATGSAGASALRTELERILPLVLQEILMDVSLLVREEIGSLRYLGPLRSLPPRHLAFTELADHNRVAGGAWAWDEVRRVEAVRAAVNVWLGSEKLKTPYELEVRSLVTAEEVRQAIEDELLTHEYDEDLPDDKATTWAETADASRDSPPAAEAASHSLAARLSRAIERAGLERSRELVLLDKRKNAVVTHRDVGVGISQVLPVLVMCYGSEQATLAMEQPEIHLHPALQAELGDVFIEAALSDRRNTVVIETHSEHLLLRIMRRIRETADGSLKAGPSITSDDVAVLYVEPYERRSVVRAMPLTRRGELAKSWPGGFFEEGLREQFDLA